MTSPLPTPGPLRQLAKTVWFTVRGATPRTARWLASVDAPVRADFSPFGREWVSACHRAAGGWQDLEVRNRSLRSRQLGLSFDSDGLVASAYPDLRALASSGWTLTWDKDGLVAALDPFRLPIGNAEQAGMAREIYSEDCYRFAAAGEWEVFDVGANTGFASLYFASLPWVVSVTAFEPFAPTAERFERCVSAHPALRTKIRLLRHGLGDRNLETTVEYHAALAGSMGISGLGAWRRKPDSKGTWEPIRIRSAAESFESLRRPRSRRVLVKLDCEGSEYEIIESLDQSGLLCFIDGLLVEWHGRRGPELAERLVSRGFMVQPRRLAPDQSLGLLSAWKSGGAATPSP